MLSLPWWVTPITIVIAFGWSTLAEWGLHRFMHDGKLMLRRHAIHHKLNWAQGWLGEFRDYMGATVVATVITGLVSLQIGLGFLVGGTIYAAIAAYAHQIQHEHPELLFWMRKPVHFLHHRENMWRHNFGITVDWWDRIFGTYKDVAYVPARPRSDLRLADYLAITWVGRRPTEEDIRRASKALDRGDDTPEGIQQTGASA